MAGTPPAKPDRPKKPLTVKERMFVEEFLVDRNPGRAYRAVFPNQSYTNARDDGNKLRHAPHIAAEIEAATSAQVTRIRLRADTVLREIARVAFADPVYLVDANDRLLPLRDIPLQARRAIKSVRKSRERVTITRAGKTRTTVRETTLEYTLCDKMAALNVLVEVMGLKKAALPPLETLLALLPPPVAAAVRAALAATAPPEPAALNAAPVPEAEYEEP